MFPCSGHSQQELQGLALHSVSCLCAAADQESHVSYILDALPILCSMLGNKDSSATVRGASLCFERLCSIFSSPLQDSNSNRVSSWQESFLEKLANCGVVEHWIGVLQDVGKREGVRAASPLPSDVFGYKPRQQIGHGQKAQSPAMAGGTLAGIFCSLAKLVATAPTVLYLVYKLDVARVIGNLLESFISQPLKVGGVEETPSTSAGSCGQAWSTGAISSTAPGFADISAEERLLQAMVLAVALLPPPGERNKDDSIKVAAVSGMDGGEERRDEAKKKSVMFLEEEQGVVVSSTKEVVKVPSVLELGVEFPWHDSNGCSAAQWSCLTCMFSNHVYALRCNVCGTIKPSLVPASVLPLSVVSKAPRSRDTATTSLQTSSFSTPDHEKLNQAETPFSSSLPCDDNANVVLVTRYDVYSSSPMYLKDYVAHVFPAMLRLVPFCANETISALILSALESLFDLGYVPDNNLLWGVSAAIGQFLSSPNMNKDAVRAVSLARKFLEAHDACNYLSESSPSPRRDWWWGGNNNLGKLTLHHRYGVMGRRTRKSHENNESLSGRDGNSYRVMYVRHGVVHHVVSLLKSLCATSSEHRLGRENHGGHEQRIALQTNLKWIILESEVLAFMSAFASGDKWILAALNNLFPQQSKAASSPEQQVLPPGMSRSRPPLTEPHTQR